MRTLQWILLGFTSAMILISCNMGGENGNASAFTQIEPDGEIRLKDESDSRYAKGNTNQDEQITQSEFEAVFKNESFEKWDLDGDKLLDFKEFKRGVFDLYEKDNNI